jgi:hypothetical protein
LHSIANDDVWTIRSLNHREHQLIDIRIGLVARICRSHSSKEDQYRQGRGSIPRFGILLFEAREGRGYCLVKNRMGGKWVERRFFSFGGEL